MAGWNSRPGGLTADEPASGDGMRTDLGEAAGGVALVQILSDLPAVLFGCLNFSSLSLFCEMEVVIVGT